MSESNELENEKRLKLIYRKQYDEEVAAHDKSLAEITRLRNDLHLAQEWSARVIAGHEQDIAEITRLRALNAELVEALKRIHKLCRHANATAFTNGVTDSTGSIDEGDVIASQIIDNARLAIAKAERDGHDHNS